ncbi:MAG TPA: aminotransferase class V-fold PLP-dependent enzyme [Longimicrobiaceae bacterium]|nr:aminotransferase class V-fold PLP-dependent enzyme [Longimicrobiaceae bacterium]
MDEVVYLDYAATSAVRPEEVIEAVATYLRDIGATPGRGGHRRSIEAGRVVLRCRLALAELFGIPGDPGRVTFQPSTTFALNTALHGVLRPGDRWVRTAYDHNSVRRPAAALAARGGRETVLSGDAEGGIDPEEAERALAGGGHPARLLVLPHASNVLGTVLPVAELAERAHAHGALVLLDAAQSAGHLPVRVDELGVDLLAFTGHKGLLGPQGTAGLWVREGVEVQPLVSGGTGGDSAPACMPAALPDRLEPGTLNGPGIAGLLAGVKWILARGVDALHARERELKGRLFRGLAAIPGVRVRSPSAPDGVGIVTITADTVSPNELARRLDREHGILTRAGLHCAPEAHALLGTQGTGAVRFSIGWATTETEIDRAVAAVAAVCAGATSGGLPAGAAARGS